MSNNLLDIERIRALTSYKFIEENCTNTEIRSACLKLPAYILSNSLLEVLLFYKNNKKIIYDNINYYLLNNNYYTIDKSKNDILKYLISQEELNIHLEIKNEILKYSNWLKKNAESIMEVDKYE